MQSVNGAQFYITCLFLLPACFAATSAPATVLVCEGVFGLHCNAVLESLSSYNFTTALFDAVLNESLRDCFAWSRNFWLYLLLNFLSSLC